MILSVSFQVFGKVQGVFFRKHTLAKASDLGLVGWVKNEKDAERSVTGTVQGPAQKIETL
jgi:acylphosphatase